MNSKEIIDEELKQNHDSYRVLLNNQLKEPPQFKKLRKKKAQEVS